MLAIAGGGQARELAPGRMFVTCLSALLLQIAVYLVCSVLGIIRTLKLKIVVQKKDVYKIEAENILSPFAITAFFFFFLRNKNYGL